MPLISRCYMIQISLPQCNVLRNLFVIDYFKDELLHKIITMYPITAKIRVVCHFEIYVWAAQLYIPKKDKSITFLPVY